MDFVNSTGRAGLRVTGGGRFTEPEGVGSDGLNYERSRCKKSFSGMISILPPASRKASAF